jgi:uncharacterized protein YecE (DUF72 family)
MGTGGAIRCGVGGWTFEPWRGAFYPTGLPQARELAYASEMLTSVEVNATYYRSQDRRTFQRWAAETPDDFVFSVKANRFATNRRELAEAEPAIERFVASGITELGPKLGPILWQFAATKVFKADEIARFAAHLPTRVDGLALRHVLEPRHPSFQCAAFVDIARAHNVAICLAVSDLYPLIADPTSDFVYLRLQTTREDQAAGYPNAALARFASHAKTFAAGGTPADLPLLTPAPASRARDCYVYFIGGAKARNPAAALAFMAALTSVAARRHS